MRPIRRGIAAAAWMLGACAAGGEVQPRAAYLQQGTHREVVVAWRTTRPEVGRVAWGTDPDRLDRVVEETAPTRDHAVRLTGLPSGTRIYYGYGAGDALTSGPDHHYDVAPPPGADAPVRFWVLGDSGTGTRPQQLVYETMQASGLPADFVIHVGDIAYDAGKASQFDRFFFGIYGDLLRNTPLWPALGNHDVRSLDVAEGRGPYFDAFVLPTGGEAGGVPSGTEAWYAFDYGPAHFVVLDTAGSSTHPESPMLDWLRLDLAANTAPWTIAFFHHPPYSDGSHDSDEETEMIRVRENVVPILEQYGVDLVLSGHSHGYERTALVAGAYETPTVRGDHVLDEESPYEKQPGARGGTIYVVAGHGGARTGGRFRHPLVVASSSVHGALWIEIDGDELRGRNLQVDGEPGDEFVLIERR